MTIREIACKSILSDTGLPADYAINCYVGCEHACCYCYARYMKRFTGHAEPWGTFVDVRVNAPEVLEREVRRKPRGSVMLSSVCDGWQPLEAKHGVSGRCIGILARVGWPISILTKSALVSRDLPLLEGTPADIGVTLTTLDERLRQVIEPHAPPTAERIEVLREAAARGIRVWAFLGPFLPLLTDTEENLEALFAAVAPQPDRQAHPALRTRGQGSLTCRPRRGQVPASRTGKSNSGGLSTAPACRHSRASDRAHDPTNQSLFYCPGEAHPAGRAQGRPPRLPGLPRCHPGHHHLRVPRC